MAVEQGAEESTETFHGGRLIARRLRAHGVSKLFTLSGGHLFSIYDGCRAEGIEIVDVRHEQSAAFAAEGWAKVTRERGVRADRRARGDQRDERDRARPANHSPVLVLGGRAPAVSLGAGIAAGDRPRPVRAAAGQARRHRRGHGRDPGAGRSGGPDRDDPPLGPGVPRLSARPRVREATEPERCSRRLPDGWRGADAAERSNVRRALCGGGAARDHGRQRALLGPRRGALLALAEKLRVPVFLNGLARGCVPADHELFFSRARSQRAERRRRGARDRACRSTSGSVSGPSFGPEAEIVAIDVAEPERAIRARSRPSSTERCRRRSRT